MVAKVTQDVPITLRLENTMLSIAQNTNSDLQSQVSLAKILSESARECRAIRSQLQRLQLQINSKFQGLLNGDQKADAKIPTVEFPAALAQQAADFLSINGLQVGTTAGLDAMGSQILFDFAVGWRIDLKALSYEQCTAILAVLEKFSSDFDSKSRISEMDRTNIFNSRSAIQTNLTQLYTRTFQLCLEILSGYQSN